MGVNKVVYDGNTLIDLSGDTLVSPEQLAEGIVAHNASGECIVGTMSATDVFLKVQEAGYTGTSEEFYALLANIGSHSSTHLPDGADPIVMQTDNYADQSVTGDKLADSAKSKGLTALLLNDGWTDNAQTINVEGVTADNNVLVAAAPASRTAWNDAEIYCSAQGEGTLTFKCGTAPTENVTANVVILV